MRRMLPFKGEHFCKTTPLTPPPSLSQPDYSFWSHFVLLRFYCSVEFLQFVDDVVVVIVAAAVVVK